VHSGSTVFRIRPDVRSLLAAASVLLVVGVMQTAPGRDLLRSAGLSGAPERYTALAFAKPASLPEQLPARRAAIRIPFSLRNEEGRDVVYRWTVVEVGARGRRQIAAGATGLRAGGDVWVRPRGRVACAGARTRIEVSLAGMGESIGFWARCPAVAGR
jgi:hypothetical protein